MKRLAMIGLGVGGLLHGQEGGVFPSLQGYAGLLNIPNAEATPLGRLDVLGSNHTDARWVGAVPWTETFVGTVGLFPWLEGAMRFTEAHGMSRDLSANAKVVLPRLWKEGPRLAFGVQDHGGMATHLRTSYGVLSQDAGIWRLSLGYGHGPQRLKGLFGGIELQPTSWLGILAEHDTQETNLGLRLATPRGWLPLGASLGALVKSTPRRSTDRVEGAVFLRVPLAGRSTKALVAPHPVAPPPGSPRDPSQVMGDWPRLRQRLIDLGFTDVAVGSQASTLVVVYENNRFNHSELDGLGVLLGTCLRAAPPELTRFRVVLKNHGLRILDLEGPVELCRAVLTGTEEPSSGLVRQAARLLRGSRSDGFGGAEMEGATVRGGHAWFRTQLILGPGLEARVGTELSAYDYRLSLKPNLVMNLWPGAALDLRWDVPLHWTRHFEAGSFFDDRGTRTQRDRVLLHQAMPLAPGLLIQGSFGQMDHDQWGTYGEASWIPGEGRHRFQVSAGRLRRPGLQGDRILVGSYRLALPGGTTVLGASAGTFLHQDRGYRLELERHFGDSILKIFFAHTQEKLAGFSLGLPMTPRRDMASRWFQIRGSERSFHGLETTLRTSTGANDVLPGLAELPETALSLRRAYTDQDRLNLETIRHQMLRLREAYLRWGG